MVVAYRRLMSVLNSFSIDSPRMTLSQIASFANMPLSTCHRLLEDLVATGMLDRDDAKTYVIGHRLWELGNLSPKVYKERTAVVPHLERIFVATGHQTVFTTLRSNGTLVVEQMVGWQNARHSAGIGEILPLHATSPGIVALAFGPSTLVALIDGVSLRPFTTSTVTDLGSLTGLVREARRVGFAVTRGTLVPETSSLSAPVVGSRGRLHGAISVVWDTAVDEDEAALAAIVTHAARAVSDCLLTTREGFRQPIVRRGRGPARPKQ